MQLDIHISWFDCEICFYMCPEKSTFNRLVLRGRDEVERLECLKLALVATEGEIYHSVHAWTLSPHYFMGEHFSLAVLCFLSAWVLHIVIITLDMVHMQTEEMVLKRKLSTHVTQLFAYFQSMGYVQLPMFY